MILSAGGDSLELFPRRDVIATDLIQELVGQVVQLMVLQRGHERPNRFVGTGTGQANDRADILRLALLNISASCPVLTSSF